MKKETFAYTPDQEYCIKMLDDWRGLHHLGPVKPWGVGIRTSVFSCALSTFDTDGLTTLVLLAHDRCVRVELGNAGPSRTAVILHRRHSRSGGFDTRHPTIEGALERWRQRWPSSEN
jgi:hypothetical protein